MLRLAERGWQLPRWLRDAGKQHCAERDFVKVRRKRRWWREAKTSLEISNKPRVVIPASCSADATAAGCRRALQNSKRSSRSPTAL